MARGRMQLEWQQTSALMVMVRNCNVDLRKTAPLGFDHFNPLAKHKETTDGPQGIPITKKTIHILKTVFVDKPTRRNHE